MLNNSNIVITTTFTEEQFKNVLSGCIIKELQTINPPPPPEENFITENEAIEILLVSKVTISKWRKEGRLKFYRIGSRVRYLRSDLLKALEIGKTRTNIEP